MLPHCSQNETRAQRVFRQCDRPRDRTCQEDTSSDCVLCPEQANPGKQSEICCLGLKMEQTPVPLQRTLTFSSVCFPHPACPYPHACDSLPVSPVMHASFLTCIPLHLDRRQTPSHQELTCSNCSVVSILGKRCRDHHRALFSDSNSKPQAGLCQLEHTHSVSPGRCW